LGVGGAPVPDFLINYAEKKNDQWRNEKENFAIENYSAFIFLKYSIQ
jgi:hypothetical protein